MLVLIKCVHCSTIQYISADAICEEIFCENDACFKYFKVDKALKIFDSVSKSTSTNIN